MCVHNDNSFKFTANVGNVLYICEIETKKKHTMKFIGIIPARYASTRFPAKPLAMLGGKPVIQRVYEQVAGGLD